ncbi:NFACT family protein [Amphibacillus sp. MSJ-3]|uniref:Rqc2 family fibronectin-binding protein n=1 Tax=Amphibacillus sp. MSJ-3 TaxID=2841505 RepID=UPI001C0E9FDB|nr:NFACT RNA binding domain-containing protein [Amphibacillus sp. MSJ-3]MBU5594615.1 NFACT family protein [Amphibacillus sp. MSJ-3]
MAFDGIVTHAVAKQLNQELATGRILKIFQPTSTELILLIRNNHENYQLLLSAHPSYARLHLTKTKYQNPAEPPMFCMVLRKHLIGSYIEAIEQYKNERIIEFYFRGKNEIGDKVRKKLIIEIMGKHSNIILLDQENDHILDSIKHISPNQSRYRTVLPGQIYHYPPHQNKLNPFEMDQSTILKILTESDKTLAETLVLSFMGISPLFADDILNCAKESTPEAVTEQFLKRLTQVKENKLSPVINRDKKEDFHVFKLDSFKGEIERFETVSELLDLFYQDKAARDRVKQQVSDLSRLLKNELERNQRKIKKQQQSLNKAKQAEQYQKQGELLTAHLHLVKKGDQQITVTDYYDPNQAELTIPLNPNKTPSQNAQSYFKTYQKLKTSKSKLKIEIRKAKAEINYFEQLIQQLDQARLEDIEEIRNELREEGYLKEKRGNNKRKNKSKKPSPEQFFASDGTPIYVGRNNKQNDYLTTKMAESRDIWLHTKDIPGSHVLIRSHIPSKETLAEAAQLAALFSKASQSSKVPVDYTEVRHVRKPNGAKPGYVIYDQQKTLFVTPDRSLINQLKEKPKESQ